MRGCFGGCTFCSITEHEGRIIQSRSQESILKEIEDIFWDVLVIDEAHEGVDTYKTDVAFDHINRKFTLHLSGTPFKALANDKFPEQTFRDSALSEWHRQDRQHKLVNLSGQRQPE